jgi:ABC-type transporter Mla maintaining outer membrane lipid asymmetry ATPase subunit MlaF
MSTPPPVELRGVDVSHPSAPTTVLLERVDWPIAAGEFHVVAGEQGSGRTALVLTAAGLGRPVAGTVRIFGHDLGTATESEQAEWRRRIGFVFENGGRLLSHLTVAENVALPLQYHLGLDAADAHERADALLRASGLAAIAGATPSRLSVRLQQRASLVRALAVPKDLLFLDNPLSGTTARGAVWWVDVLRRVRSERPPGELPLTVVATCDDFGPWLELGSHFALIERRRLRLLGGRAALTAGVDDAVRDFLSLRWASRT